MKVAVEVTESFEGENVKQEFEGDFFQVTSLKRTCDSENGHGFHIRSMSLGERFKPDEVVEALADNMLNTITELSNDRDEMAALAAKFCTVIIRGAKKKFNEMEAILPCRS